MESCGSWPRTYYINLPLVHLDIVFTNLVTEELGGGLVEGAFLGFEEELEFSLVLEDLQNMLAIFSQGPGVHRNVIYETYEHLVHKILEYRGGVDKPIRHNSILVMACRCQEGGLPLILLMFPEEVANALEVHRALDGGRINGEGPGIGRNRLRRETLIAPLQDFSTGTG